MAKFKLILAFLVFVIPKIAFAQTPVAPPQAKDIPDLIRELVAAFEYFDWQFNDTRSREVPQVMSIWQNSNDIANQGIAKISPLNLFLAGGMFALGISVVALPCGIGCYWVKLILRRKYRPLSQNCCIHDP